MLLQFIEGIELYAPISGQVLFCATLALVWGQTPPARTSQKSSFFVVRALEHPATLPLVRIAPEICVRSIFL